MAIYQNAGFEVKVSNHEFDSLATITGIFEGNSGPEAVSAGVIAYRNELMDNEGYEAYGVKNTNSWKMTPANADAPADVPRYACDPGDVNMVQDPATGNIYKVGANTLGMAVPAGYPCTWRRIYFDNVCVYRFGVGLLTAELGSAKYVILGDDGRLTPSADMPSDPAYFEVVREGTFTEGTTAAHGFVDLRACRQMS